MLMVLRLWQEERCHEECEEALRCLPPLVSAGAKGARDLLVETLPTRATPARLLGLALGEFGEGPGGKQGEEMGDQKAWRLLAVVATAALRLSTKRQSASQKGSSRRKTRLEFLISPMKMFGGLYLAANMGPIFRLETYFCK